MKMNWPMENIKQELCWGNEYLDFVEMFWPILTFLLADLFRLIWKKNCCGRRGVSAADVPFHSHPSLCNTLLSFIIKYRRTLILIIENVFQELCWANWMPLYNRLMAALLRFFIKVLIKLTIQYQLSTRKSNILKNELCWMKWKCSLMHFIALPLESTTSYGIDQIFKKS